MAHSVLVVAADGGDWPEGAPDLNKQFDSGENSRACFGSGEPSSLHHSTQLRVTID